MTFTRKHHSDLSKKKISEALKGHSAWNKGIKFEAICGEKHYLYGKHRTEETKAKISRAKKGKPSLKKGITAKEDTRIASGSRSGNWKGGRIVVNGYIKVINKEHPNNHNGYVFEHRLVMEKILGRYMEKWETVHHLNGIRDNNNPENLELWIVAPRTGIRVRDFLEFYKNKKWI